MALFKFLDAAFYVRLFLLLINSIKLNLELHSKIQFWEEHFFNKLQKENFEFMT